MISRWIKKILSIFPTHRYSVLTNNLYPTTLSLFSHKNIVFFQFEKDTTLKSEIQLNNKAFGLNKVTIGWRAILTQLELENPAKPSNVDPIPAWTKALVGRWWVSVFDKLTSVGWVVDFILQNPSHLNPTGAIYEIWPNLARSCQI